MVYSFSSVFVFKVLSGYATGIVSVAAFYLSQADLEQYQDL